jgi:hypothetical protein
MVEMSAPAQNAFSPAPVRTTARTPSSASISSRRASSASNISGDIALSASGRFRVTSATCSRRSSSTDTALLRVG